MSALLLDWARYSITSAPIFRHDLVAGVSVAAVALPVGVAYAQLAGFNPVVGLYANILPLVAYAIVQLSSRLLPHTPATLVAMNVAAAAARALGLEA